eukprot:Stramenopile-MAST_4_protein_6872
MTPCECIGCENLAKAELPSVAHYRGLFPDGQEEVMAIGGVSTDGSERLSLAAVKQILGATGILQRVGGNTLQNVFTACDGVFKAMVIGSLVGPCDATCKMKKPDAEYCLQTMKNTTCLASIR